MIDLTCIWDLCWVFIKGAPFGDTVSIAGAPLRTIAAATFDRVLAKPGHTSGTGLSGFEGVEQSVNQGVNQGVNSSRDQDWLRSDLARSGYFIHKLEYY